MAIILDPKEEPVSVRPERTSDSWASLDYPVFPSGNPGYPYVPSSADEAWNDPTIPGWDSEWHGEPSLTSPYEDLSPEERKAYVEFEEILKKNQTVAFEKKDVKRHIYANKTYSGVDVEVSISLPGQPTHIFDDLTNISVSSHRENFPVRLLGMVNPAGFTGGGRTIGGSFIFSMIEYNPFYKVAADLYGSSAKSLWDSTPAADYPLADALPPFDITITLNNEYEQTGVAMRIFGVKIVDEGQNFSSDDLITELTYSYMASGVAPVHVAKGWKADTSSYLEHWGIE